MFVYNLQTYLQYGQVSNRQPFHSISNPCSPSQINKNNLNCSLYARSSRFCFIRFTTFCGSHSPRDQPSHLLTQTLNKLLPPTSPSSQTLTQQTSLLAKKVTEEAWKWLPLQITPPFLPKGHLKNFSSNSIHQDRI